MSTYDCAEYKRLERKSEQAYDAFAEEINSQQHVLRVISVMLRQRGKLKEDFRQAAQRLADHARDCIVCGVKTGNSRRVKAA